MASSSKYIPSAKSFVNRFPIGNEYRVGDVRDFIKDNTNGLAADALIDDPAKQVKSGLKHVNAGAADPFYDQEPFYAAYSEKVGMVSVVPLAQRYDEQARGVVFKSTVAAVKPLDQMRGKLEGLPSEHLDEEAQRDIAARIAEIDQALVPLRRSAVEAVENTMVLRLIANGKSEQVAREIVQALPAFRAESKLLTQLRGQ